MIMEVYFLIENVIQKLKKFDFDADNLAGVIAILDNCDDTICYYCMLKYLDNTRLSRNDIFEYAFNVTNTEFDEFEIV